MRDLTIVIPSRNEDETLEKTLRDLQKNMRGNTDVHIVLDRWTPSPQINMEDTRFTFHYFADGIGQRGGINYVARLVDSRYLFKLDAHCAVSEGFDVVLVQSGDELGRDVTQVPLMYNLDVATWLPKHHKRTVSMYLGMEKGGLRALYYDRNQPDDPHSDFVETMACMGPGWCVDRLHFLEHGGCDEQHGGQAGWGAQSVEVSCKAWLSGGRLVTNKRCWFAHFFRGGIGFPYHISGRDVATARAYSTDLWVNDKWPLAKRPFQFLIDKFNPPGWEPRMPTNTAFNPVEYNSLFKTIIRNDKLPTWRGVPCIKFPADLLLYAEVIHNKKPDLFIEVGTSHGGSTLFFADAMEAAGHGHVISVDINSKTPLGKAFVSHPRVTYLQGRSTAVDTLATLAELTAGKTCMVCLDGDHHRAQVKRELHYYSRFVTPGQYLVVEDIYQRDGTNPAQNGPGEALAWFLKLKRNFKPVPLDERFVYSITKGGWLCKI